MYISSNSKYAIDSIRATNAIVSGNLQLGGYWRLLRNGYTIKRNVYITYTIISLYDAFVEHM